MENPNLNPLCCEVNLVKKCLLIRLAQNLTDKFFHSILLLIITSFSSMVIAQDMGIDYVDDDSGIVWFDAGNASVDWSYICLNGCYPGTKNGNRVERQFDGLSLGVTYTISAQIQDNSVGQLTPSGTITFENGSSTPSCQDGLQNGDETGVDCGGSCASCPVAGENVTIQAEDGNVFGGATVYPDGAANGGQGVAYISSNGAGVGFSSLPATISIDVRYASEQSGSISIFVNNSNAGDLTFNSTGSWVGSYQIASTNVIVPSGGTFEFRYQSGDAALNIDEITFITDGDIEPTCSDGLQNGDEAGVDCGGSNCDACPPETYTLIVNDGSGDGQYEDGSVVDISWETPSVEPGTGIAFTSWTGDILGIADVNNENTTITIQPSNTEISSNFEILYSCSDNVRNGNETNVDCGGDCNSCDALPIVSSADNSNFGLILVGGSGSSQEGFTMYTWDNDNGGPFSNCEGSCVDNWPPVLVQGVASAVIPNNLPSSFDKEFGVSGRCDGTYQLTYGNEPLYFFSGDNVAGDANGEGPVWHVAVDTEDNNSNCSDGIQNGDETGIDCGGSCGTPCDPGAGQCEGYGLSFVGGQAVLYSHESLGAPCYMCTGPGFNGCNSNFYLEDGFYKMDVSVSVGQQYSFGIQCGPNVLVEGVAGQGNECWLSPSCNDGYLNGGELEIDCGGPNCPACPTCDDGIQNGDETGIDCGGSNCTGVNADCATVCNGTPNPFADFVVANESVEGQSDGSITFTFPDISGRSTLEFSIDGSSFAYSSPDNAGSLAINNLSPGDYELWVRWLGGDCPMNLGSVTVHVGPPAPTCSDGILNQGEEGVDCGGPCTECAPNNCGNIPLVTYPKPALPTAIIGADPGQGFAVDVSNDLTSVDIRYGAVVGGQSGGNPQFEFYCSCNQIEFFGVSVDGPTAVPQECINAGDYYYFVRYQKQGNTTDDPGDIYVYSGLFTTEGARIDPDNRGTLISSGANWMRFRHPHAQDGITEAVFDAQHNGDLLRNLDRFSTTFTDGSTTLIIDPILTRGDAGSRHPHGGVPNATPVRIDYMEVGNASPPVYAKSANTDAGKWGWGNIITYEITAVTGGSGAQTYNTFQNYVIGEGLNTFGDPRHASAGKATTNMVLPGFGSHKQLEHDAIFTQHIITLQSEDDVDDFLEGHHVFHGVRHRQNGNDPGDVLGEVKIGQFACGDCHFRDGRSSEVFETPRGPRIAPPVYGAGLLEWVAGREAGFRWDGGVSTVSDQTRNALIEDHQIDPDTEISPQELDLIIKYVEFLSVPARSYAAYDNPGVVNGNVKFMEVGCASCHTVSQKTRNDAPEIFRDIVLRPYTDMRVHTVTDEPIRTPALWGIGRNIKLLNDNGKALLFMHDGRATSLMEAIQAHGGEASGSRGAFNNLSNSDQQDIIEFLESL